MFSMLLVVLYSVLCATVVAQSSFSVVCVAGQCLQGSSNTTIGAKLSAPGAPTSIHLLPGQYTSTTNPQLLHNLLTSSSATLSGSPGFQSASLSSLPLNLQLEPGVAIYPQRLYSGQAAFSQLPSAPLTNASTPLAANAIALASNVWMAVTSSSSSRVIFWESIPDVTQLPSSLSGSFSLLDIQSSSCSPPCAGAGVCSATGSCTCPAGFTGTSCESCADGFFGPTCQSCPEGCTSCDQGISGTGRCLTPIVETPPSKCNCLNGKCEPNGQCTCNPGWTTSDNGTACAKCASGFFLSSTGDCQVCQLGCTQCADGSGTCISCKAGFTQDANDKTKCNPVPSQTTDGTRCPDGSFSSGAQCAACSPACRTCNGPTSNDCTLCSTGSYLFNGNCVPANSDGICQGTNGMIADNNKNECDTCGAKCTSCKIPNFSVASTVNQLQCTACLPGFFLSQGKCVASCPTGTFVSPLDNLTCTACSSSCSTCIGSADFCLSCPGGQLASSGKCVSSCPSDTFSSSGSCIKCHPDCSSCSGPSFNQCTSCPPSRPVLTNGRCLPTCSKSQYFDSSSSSCQACDSSCSSCSGPGPQNCFACSSSTQVLRAGSCVSANCQGTTSVIPTLGLCLSELVEVPRSSGTTPSPLPSITGLTDPTVTNVNRGLAWWEILLMALGCAFIVMAFLWCWRRRARKQREKRTKVFARVKNLDGPRQGWRWRLVRFGERLFGSNKTRPELPVVYNHHTTSRVSWASDHKTRDIKLQNLAPPKSEITQSKKRETVDDLISAYQYSTRTRSNRIPSILPSLNERGKDDYTRQLKARIEQDSQSLYSELTGNQRLTSEPRQAIKKDPVGSRNSVGSSIFVPVLEKKLSPKRENKAMEGVLVDVDSQSDRMVQTALPLQVAHAGIGSNMTEAQAYMLAVRPAITGASAASQGRQPLPHHPIPTFATTPVHPDASEMTSTMPFIGATTPSGSIVPVPVTLTPNPTGGQGSYWLTPVTIPPSQMQQQHPIALMASEDTVVLQPTHTGASSTGSSYNPFRKGSY